MRDRPDKAPAKRIEPDDAPPGIVEQLDDGGGLIDPRPLPGFGAVPIVPGDAFHVERDDVEEPDQVEGPADAPKDHAAGSGRNVDSGEF